MNDTTEATSSSAKAIAELRAATLKLIVFRDQMQIKLRELRSIEGEFEHLLVVLAEEGGETEDKIDEINEEFDLNYTTNSYGELIGLIDEDVGRVSRLFFPDLVQLSGFKFADQLLATHGEDNPALFNGSHLLIRRDGDEEYTIAGSLGDDTIEHLNKCAPWAKNISVEGGTLRIEDPKNVAYSEIELSQLIENLPTDLRVAVLRSNLSLPYNRQVVLVATKNIKGINFEDVEAYKDYLPIGVINADEESELDILYCSISIDGIDGRLYGGTDGIEDADDTDE